MSSTVEKKVRIIRNYVNGAFIEPANSGYIDVENPSTGEIIGSVPLSTAAEVNRTVEIAYEAYKGWSKTPVARRVSYLFKLYELMRDHEEDLARQIVEENGKSMPDALAEMKRAIENVEVACGMPVLQQGENIIGSSFDIDGEVIRLPLGVFGMIAPFNFPAMVPFWFIPYAIATGNTFIVKPSKQVPLTLQMVAEYFHEAGLPPGVFNVVNGDREVANALMEHRRIKGISLVGSTPVARQVARKCAESGKRYQAMGG
ncbi:MAG TPA: aldehyde dehydrogenase family protein, partial [Spirochaetia bacterium]|nr:aldehyde dehydrogenase family protein [Spirochaetia bacterium]